MEHYDAIIIGSGQGGTPLAKKFAGEGYNTALVERRFVGGTCVNDGCTPTKAMVASAQAAHICRTSERLGVHCPQVRADMTSVIDRQRSIVKSFRDSAEKDLLETKNLTLIYGEGSFGGHKQVKISKRDGTEAVLAADLIVIDTGTRPKVPDIAGVESIPYLTSTSILELTELPGHLLIVGGGYVALEFGQMYKRFGSKVTILERSDRLLSREDEDIAQLVFRMLSKEGIDFRLGAQVTSFSTSAGAISVNVRIKDETDLISCTHVLIATGRTPNTESLNLPATSLRTNEKGFVEVNDRLETIVPGIYAIGEVNGGPAFTHISYHDHLIVFRNVVKKENESTRGRLVPYCIYTDPQLGRVGLTEQQAREQGVSYTVASLPMKHVARAIETGNTEGLIKAIIDPSDKTILGAAVLGAEGGEIMSMLQLAMMGNIRCDSLRDAVFAHPAFAESLNNLFSKI
jgi:pyruvate/2-oxoglutarate dehydrogenase complex dihydrolipoamide dehydrogenase (E3) component